MARGSGRYRALREPREMKGGAWRVTGRGETMGVDRIAGKLEKALGSSFIGATGIRVRVHGPQGLYVDAVDVPKGASRERIAEILREFGEDLEVEVDRYGEYWNYEA